MTSRFLRSRLYKDLAEVHDSPYPGVSVFTNDADIRKLCLVLTPPSGPWKNLSLHFDVQLPAEWPKKPPTIKSSVQGIEHPNLFDSLICCDLLRLRNWSEQGYTGGYTPALTLHGLFLQFLTFFSSSKIEQEYGGSVDIGDYIVTRYLTEDTIAQQSPEQDSDDRVENQETQLRLEKLWNADTSEEIVVNSSAAETGVAVEMTKKAMLSSSDPGTRIHKFEQVNPRWESTYAKISKWSCRSCPYGTPEVPHWAIPQPPVLEDAMSPLLSPPSTSQLPKLNEDILLAIVDWLPSESLFTFSEAYPRLQALVNSMHIHLRRELHCFFLRTSLNESVLGIGIAYQKGLRKLSSDFDWLSEAAFTTFSVRKSIQKRAFELFLPLAFSRPHFSRAEPRIWVRLAEIERFIREADLAAAKKKGRTPTQPTLPPAHRHDLVGPIYKMMNNIVVALMRSCDDALGKHAYGALLHASERAVTSYCLLFHLLVSLARTTPMIFDVASKRIQRFFADPSARLKKEAPDLGELIIMLILVLALQYTGSGPDKSSMSWQTFNGPFLEEVIVRNVRWVLMEAPELELMEPGCSDYRLEKTFEKSKTSLRLMMFQIAFLDIFVNSYASDLSYLDDTYGFPNKEIPERMVGEIKEIYKVTSWPGFFQRVQYVRGTEFGKEILSDLLRTAIKTSADRGYHTPVHPGNVGELKARRELAEREWRAEILKAQK